MLFTNDCRSCFPVQNLYKCICSLHMLYVHGGVISLYILYSILLYCVHLNDIAVKDVKMNDVNDVNIVFPIVHLSHRSPFQYYMKGEQ